MRQVAAVILALCIVVLVAIGGTGLFFYQQLTTPYPMPSDSRFFLVTPGLATSGVIQKLSKEGYLPAVSATQLWARIRSQLGHPIVLKVGEYELVGQMTAWDVLETIEKNKVVLRRVTIPEGFTIFQVAEALANQGLGSFEDNLAILRSPRLIQDRGWPGLTLEGYLFPETYSFSRLDPPERVIKGMLDKFDSVFTPELKDRGKELGLNPYEIIILASMIERETGVPSERQTISSVFHNRLKKKMRLQSDPTTIYPLLPTFSGNITREHLRLKNDYNTYTIPRLPAGPIANPGLAALQAAVDPEDTNYLFFVSRNDGSHIFSETYQEHNQWVEQFQRSRRRQAQ